MVLYVLGALGMFVGLAWCAAFLPPRIRAKAWRKRLLRASANELAEECAKSARFMGFAEWGAGRSICAVREWTERDLLSALEDLYEEATRADPLGISGYGSHVFMYYDGGFATISELLRDRLGISQPWAKRRPPSGDSTSKG